MSEYVLCKYCRCHMIVDTHIGHHQAYCPRGNNNWSVLMHDKISDVLPYRIKTFLRRFPMWDEWTTFPYIRSFQSSAGAVFLHLLIFVALVLVIELLGLLTSTSYATKIDYQMHEDVMRRRGNAVREEGQCRRLFSLVRTSHDSLRVVVSIPACVKYVG